MLTWCLVDLHFSVACIGHWSLGGLWGTGIHVPGTEQAIVELLFGLRMDGRGGIGWMEHAYTRMTLFIMDGWPRLQGIKY